MAKKAQREWTQVSQFVGQITFSVSSGKAGEPNYVPKTEGFTIEVTYDNESQKMYDALSTKVIEVQNPMRKFFVANKRFPFQPAMRVVDGKNVLDKAKVQKVNGKGEFTLPVASHVDRLEVAMSNNQVSIADQIRLAKMIGLKPLQAWLDQVESAESVSEDEPSDDDELFKYPEGSLDKLVIAKLKIIAQNEELEGYDELTADEIRKELYAIEK